MARQTDEREELQVELEPVVRVGRIPRFITWHTYSCPACGKDLEIRLKGPTKTGVEYSRCEYCGQAYRTPDKEWAHMNVSERIGHFCAPWTAMAITMAGVIGFTEGLLENTSRFGNALRDIGIVSVLWIPHLGMEVLLGEKIAKALPVRVIAPFLDYS
jgi:predicted RNA-binding Zn-ribbon protein involved in translation (DUF1610 family)